MYWYLILFLIVMFLLSQKEHMTESTHQVLGPGSEPPLPEDTSSRTHISRDSTIKSPRLYDPMRSSSKTPGEMGPTSDFNPDQAPPDTGSNSSDTTTQQNAIYFYKTVSTLPFPKADGPPVPFLNDFKVFQK